MHTKGPWHMQRDMDHVIIGRQPWSQVWSGDHKICTLSAPNSRNVLQTYEANALLISKSPDMYEILKAIQAWWREGSSPLHCDSQLIGESSICDEIDNVLSCIEMVNSE